MQSLPEISPTHADAHSNIKNRLDKSDENRRKSIYAKTEQATRRRKRQNDLGSLPGLVVRDFGDTDKAASNSMIGAVKAQLIVKRWVKRTKDQKLKREQEEADVKMLSKQKTSKSLRMLKRTLTAKSFAKALTKRMKKKKAEEEKSKNQAAMQQAVNGKKSPGIALRSLTKLLRYNARVASTHTLTREKEYKVESKRRYTEGSNMVTRSGPSAHTSKTCPLKEHTEVQPFPKIQESDQEATSKEAAEHGQQGHMLSTFSTYRASLSPFSAYRASIKHARNTDIS